MAEMTLVEAPALSAESAMNAELERRIALLSDPANEADCLASGRGMIIEMAAWFGLAVLAWISLDIIVRF